MLIICRELTARMYPVGNLQLLLKVDEILLKNPVEINRHIVVCSL
jgi:hypothetical protein